MYCFGLNTTWAPMDNKLVRQALNYAINRKRWVEGYFQDTSVSPSRWSGTAERRCTTTRTKTSTRSTSTRRSR